MTVETLIKRLQRFNPRAVVTFPEREYEYYEIVESASETTGAISSFSDGSGEFFIKEGQGDVQIVVLNLASSEHIASI